MSGGEISGNTAYSSYSGGGVYVGYGVVYVNRNWTFTKQLGGVIYGSDAGDALKNTAGSDGHAVYADFNSGPQKRNATAGPGVILDSSVSGSAGGWE